MDCKKAELEAVPAVDFQHSLEKESDDKCEQNKDLHMSISIQFDSEFKRMMHPLTVPGPSVSKLAILKHTVNVEWQSQKQPPNWNTSSVNVMPKVGFLLKEEEPQPKLEPKTLRPDHLSRWHNCFCKAKPAECLTSALMITSSHLQECQQLPEFHTKTPGMQWH